MEAESATEGPFLKIETIWSETEENFSNITVKEENISDTELEDLPCKENYNFASNDKIDDRNSFKSGSELQETSNNNDKLVNKDGNEKTLKCTGASYKASCLHDAKNFKVIKKRLRCSDCKSVLCPECYRTIISSVQTHFSKSDNNNKLLYPCKLCSMIFKSNCALQAHIRIHLLDTPYVCPDCGAVYNNIYFLSLHLINKCYHVYKVITNGCKFCLSQNMSPEDYVSHIEKSHITSVFKCSICCMLFENVTDINRHLVSIHKHENALSLSYFRCSMCGNLIISRHLYAKHIKYHQEHSAAFQIGYLCSCGSSFNTASSFRSHFKSCSKKGILPPQWTYLQVTLKTQEMLQVQGTMQKRTFLHSETRTDSKFAESNELNRDAKNSNLFQDGDSSDELDELSDGTSMNNSNDSEIFKTKQNQDNRGKGTEVGSLCCDTSLKVTRDAEDGRAAAEENFEKSAVKEQSKNNALVAKNSSNSVELSGDRRGSKEVSCAETNIDKSGSIPIILTEELSLESQICNSNHENSEINKENDKTIVGNGDKSLKIVYDHIPCDHLGYLKTQQHSECHDKNGRKSANRNCDYRDVDLVPGLDNNYIITSVLDEKTGMMRTKKVLVQNQMEEADGGFVEVDFENSEALSNIQCQEMQNPRSSNFFSCPFCAVLFSKHFSSFQRFRLHLECYHPDASLDITVDRTQIPKSQIQFTSLRASAEFHPDDDDDVSYDLDDIDLQTRLDNFLKESNKEQQTNKSSVLSRNVNLSDGNKNKKGVSSINDERNKTESPELNTKQKSGKNHGGKDEEKKSVTSSYTSDVCKTKIDDTKINENNQDSTHLLADDSFGASDNRKIEDKETPSHVKGIQENFTYVDGDSGQCQISMITLKKKDGESISKVESEQGKKAVLHRKRISILNHKSKRMNEDTLSYSRGFNESRDLSNNENLQQIGSGSDQDVQSDKNCLRSLLDKDHYVRSMSDNSKSQSEELSSGDFDRSDPMGDVSEGRGRSAERRNSRRESDVWSEFYKTLKIAETFKKTKVRNQEKYVNDGAPILTNYTNKRVVKKPKRYRESSDSEESNEDEKFFPNCSRNRLDQDDEEVYDKKKKLLNRLKSVDYRILDYVFKLLERKQKNNSLLRKTAEGSIKSTRKKLINGMKVAGKQQKVVTDIDDDVVEFSNTTGDKDLSGEDYEWEGTSMEEKKKSKQKKSEGLIVKERRRSDFEREVNIIEKNLEADENDYFTQKRKRKLSSKLQYYKKGCGPIEKNDFSSGQVITTNGNADTEKKLTCAVCKENSATETEFREHIKSHRMDDNSYQCMECGECFVVRPSLEKHLHAFHKIKDVQKYIEENNCSVMEKDEEIDNEPPLKENQCKVCKDEFANIHDLNKHFRIHGMAFLRQFKKDSKTN